MGETPPQFAKSQSKKQLCSLGVKERFQDVVDKVQRTVSLTLSVLQSKIKTQQIKMLKQQNF